MKILLLNSGIGKRLFPLTKNQPKCLIKLDSKSILDIQIEILSKFNIDEIIITTGPFANQIKQAVTNFQSINFTFVHNELFTTTNYIYSMWKARHLMNDDLLLLHGDLLFDPSIIKRLFAHPHHNHVVVNKTVPPPEKDFKAKITNNRVYAIGVNLNCSTCYFCAPLYYLTNQTTKAWFEQIEKFVKKGKLDPYAEDALNVILEEIILEPLFITDELCMEIDTPSDLEIAKKVYQQIN